MLRVIIKIGRAIFGGIGIFIAVVGIAFLLSSIYAIIGERQNPKLLEMAIRRLKTGAIIASVGLPLFGVCAGALKRPLYFLVPIILTISFILAVILLPVSMLGMKGEGAVLGALALTILAFRFINKYYAKRESDESEQRMRTSEP